jgi:trans-aconitate methyltransferase
VRHRNLSLALASRYPESRITLVDAAPEMIDVTRARLLALEPASARRIEFVTARFEEFTAAAGTFDLVTSCISLHHVRDKGPLYQNLAAAIASGGTLRFADQLRGGTEANPCRQLGPLARVLPRARALQRGRGPEPARPRRRARLLHAPRRALRAARARRLPCARLCLAQLDLGIVTAERP